MSPQPTHTTLIHDTPDAWAQATLEQMTPGSFGLEVNDGRAAGSVTSAPLSAPPFDELLPSWNVTLPTGGTFTLEVRALVSGENWTPWYTFGTWTDGAERSSVPGQRDEHARVLTDTLRLSALSDTFQYRAHLTGVGSALHLLAFATSDRAQHAAAPRPGQPEAWERELDIPERSQMVHEGGEGWCSPTCLSMVLSTLGTDITVPDTAAAVHDEAYGGTGNWAFNVAYAGSRGHRAYLTRLPDLRAAEDLVLSGVAPILSVAWQEGELPGAPLPTSNGHLVVLRGFDASGNPVINDPAAATDAEVRRVYPRQAFERQWLGHSGGLSYLIR